MMEWSQLLSLRKHGDQKIRHRKDEDEIRLGFEVDYDRIIFSSAFRMLQDKTQVIPLSKTSFVHTRLTHSLEVSVVGRSLGRGAGKEILKKNPGLKEMGYHYNDFGAVVAAAALAHDIGNPPFGHSGEAAIGDYFSKGNGRRFRKYLTEKQYQDLVDFEGNANGFRILTESKNGVDGGLRLTYATLGAFIKYPKQSLPKKPTSEAADRKFGVFQSEVSFFEEVAAELGLVKRTVSGGYARHPLTYLVEAADDICYTIIDFEDGVNLGWISEEKARETLEPLVRDNLRKEIFSRLITKRDRMAYLRAVAIRTLIEEAVDLFLEQQQALLEGKLSQSLLELSSYKNEVEKIIEVSAEKIYRSPEVRDKEIAGYTILTTLLDGFTTAFENYYNKKTRPLDLLLIEKSGINPDQFLSPYDFIMACCGFVSMLTDGNALQIFQKIKGQL